MHGMIAYCGLTCHTCPIYLATREENKEEQIKKRIGIAELCKAQYGMHYGWEDITDCDGCTTEGEKLFSACKKCPIRMCAREKALENCAYCPEYACSKLASFFKTDPAAAARLEQIRKAIRNVAPSSGRPGCLPQNEP